jgi:hypothetical protein
MPQREPTAAQALYPNLRQATPNEVEQQRKPTLAEALWPRPPQPSPRELWRDRFFEMVGLRRQSK